MADPVTTNKLLAIPTPGSDSGTWGASLNNGTFTPIDLMIGGILSLALSSSNYTFSSSDIQNFGVKLTGALLADINIYTSNIGFFFVENNTSGAHAVTIQCVTTTNYPSSGSTVGSGVVIGQGSRNFFVSDQTAGIRRADTSLFPTGTSQAFYNSSAPTGWTQVTANNDFAMRIISGSGGVSHSGGGFFTGSTDAHTLVVGEMPAHTHPGTTASDAGHTHGVGYGATGGSGGPAINGGHSGAPTGSETSDFGFANITVSVASQGGGGSHSHNLSGLSMLDLILCSKN